MTVEEEKQEPYYLFHMDGTPHYQEAATHCCGQFSKICICGGVCHYQPVYGGYYYKCESCFREDQ